MSITSINSSMVAGHRDDVELARVESIEDEHEADGAELMTACTKTFVSRMARIMAHCAAAPRQPH